MFQYMINDGIFFYVTDAREAQSYVTSCYQHCKNN